MRVIKIDTTRDFQPFASNNVLNWIIRESSFKVEQGKHDDWKVCISYLEKMRFSDFQSQSIPPLDTGPLLFNLHAERGAVLERLRDQTNMMYGVYSNMFDDGMD
jgi:hypothetical protein